MSGAAKRKEKAAELEILASIQKYLFSKVKGSIIIAVLKIHVQCMCVANINSLQAQFHFV